MMANSCAAILVELEDAVASSPPERCARIFAGIVRLLGSGGEAPQEMLVAIVDGVLLRLTERVAPGALVGLSTALAEQSAAPPKTLRRLASHEHPDVACPVLLKSQALTATELAAIAASSGERQRLAICARDGIEPGLAKALITNGSRAVLLALIANPSTRFSDEAYAALIARAGRDEEITKAVALRPDTPDAVVRKLLRSGEGTAEKRSASSPAPDVAPALATPKLPCADDYANARPEIVALNRIGKLNDSTVNRFAIRGDTANLFTALSVLSGAPIEIVEQVMADDDCEGLVMACRASRLNWQTTLAILSNRSGKRLSFAERERAQLIFENLLLSTSQWTVRWGEIANARGQRGAKMGVSR
jgi:uncharacterized protein (DUF2336 family)